MAKKNRRRAPAEPLDVKEALRRHIGDASRALRSPALSDETIHRVRKELKRARASLRLLRAVIGKADYRREDAALRAAARPLGRVRDAKVLVETLDAIAAHETSAARQALLLKLRGAFEKARLTAHDETTAAGDAATSATVLEEAWARVDRWRFVRARPAAMRDGLKRVYRDARKALTDVRAHASAENLHDWRKQVKYLWHAMEACKGCDAAALARRVKETEALAAKLGLDHDLDVLQSEVEKLHSRASGARAGLFTEITDRRTKLQSTALKQGRRLFKLTPRGFVKKLVGQSA